MKQSIIFNGNCVANSELTLASERINFGFRLVKFVASFAIGTAKTLRIKVFVSRSEYKPDTGEPGGVNILGLFGEDPYVVGDDEQKRLEFDIRYRDAGYYMKVYADNKDNYDHTVDCYAVIESLED